MSGHVAANSETRRTFLPGMGVDWLLPLYDPITTLLGLDHARRQLLRQAELCPGHRVLDIGCGTGTLIVMLARTHRDVQVVGLDPDPKALDRARALKKSSAVSAATVDKLVAELAIAQADKDRAARRLHEEKTAAMEGVERMDGRRHRLEV